MTPKVNEEILKIALIKVLCYKQSDGTYKIVGHDYENAQIKVEEIMDLIRVALQTNTLTEHN